MAVGVSVVTNSYNCKENVFRLLRSVKDSYKNLEVVVVDNGSTDNTLPEGKKKYKWVKWVDAGNENLGWGGGYNVGFINAKKGNHVLLIDSDVVATKSLIKGLVARLNNPKVGIVTPMITYLSDKDWVNQAGAHVNLWTGKVSVGWGPKKDFLKAKRVQNSGTVLLIRNKVIEKIGGFDNWFTGYLDPDYCLRAARAGYETWYEPKSLAYHDQSRDKRIWGPRLFKRAYLVGRNRTLFMRRHGINLFVYICFLFPLLGYYLKESLKYGLFFDWIRLVGGTVDGFFYKLNNKNLIALGDIGKKKLKFHFFALAATGKGISGGDRIFIELARRWRKENIVNVYITTEGEKMCDRNFLKGKNIIFHVSKVSDWGFLLNYFYRIFLGIKMGLTLLITDASNTFVYSASDFWMDVFPAFLLKVRSRQIRWVAAWYQTAPNPIKGYHGRYKLSAFFYFLSQLPMRPLISRYCDFVFVNNENERKVFNSLDKKGKAYVFIGAVDLRATKKWKDKFCKVKKIYDAVFQGRFHPQKGVVELVQIWKLVTKTRPKAKLAMIGDGPLMGDVKDKISKLNLEKNITCLGYVFDGEKKYKTFAQSKIVVHPALYDSGGMAASEAMAFGLPCIGFDLPAYKSYYPSGMKKVKIGNLQKFAQEIVSFIEHPERRKKFGLQAVEMIKESWSWETRASLALDFINAKN